MRIIVSTLVFLLATAQALATTVTLQREGKAIEGGEVCRFAADDRENPFKRWLTADGVTCVPAGSGVTFPPGRWNVFARLEGKSVGTPQLVEGSRAPSQLTFSAAPAGTLITALGPDLRGVFYVPRLSYAIPAESRTTVPAGEELWLFVIEREKETEKEEQNRKLIVRNLLSIPAVGEGATRGLEPRPGATSNLVGWLRVPPELRVTVAKLKTLPKVAGITPTGFAIDGDPLPDAPLLHGSFVRVRGLGVGAVSLSFGGERWLPDTQNAVIADSVTLVPSPLRVRPAGSLMVNWSSVKNLFALNASIGVCSRDRRAPKLEIVLSRCTRPLPEKPLDASTCAVVHRASGDVMVGYGSYPVDDLLPGFYRVEMQFGDLPPVSGTELVIAHEQRNVYVRADYEQMSGSLMKGGRGLVEPSTLKFDATNGIGASLRLLPSYMIGPRIRSGPPAASSAGEDPAQARRRRIEEMQLAFQTGYQAVVKSLPKTDTQIEVAACDGDPRVIVLSDRAPKPGERFDIVVPDNELRLRVIDTYTRALLPEAPIRYTVLSKSEPHTPVLTESLWTGTEAELLGIAVVTSLPERKTQFTVSYPGYDRQTVGPLTLTDRERRTIEVQMVPSRGGRSRIISPTPFVNGAIYWYSSDGIEKEAVELFADGTFVSAGNHGTDETMAVISESHPLWVRSSPRLDGRRSVEIPFPAIQGRDFDVVIAEDEKDRPRYVGLVIGGLRVPLAALHQSQAVWNQPATVRGSRPMNIRAIGESGAIEVLLGPHVNEVPARWQSLDIFTLPMYADSPRQRLEPESSGIFFDER